MLLLRKVLVNFLTMRRDTDTKQRRELTKPVGTNTNVVERKSVQRNLPQRSSGNNTKTYEKSLSCHLNAG